jgi:ferric-dicitrate binding protein FerR (iron transport regulator)
MPTDARSASPSPLSKPTLISDEAALKRVFDAEFETCLASAKSQLADATVLAPRVVETTFVSVWKQRGTIATQDQLKAVLNDEIRHGSARALSRRSAASRFAGGKQATGSHSAAASEAPEDVWANIHKTLNASSAEAHAALDKAGRHEAASHMKFAAKKKNWLVPVVILVVAVGVSIGGVMYVSRLGVDDATLAAVSNTAIQPLVTSSPGQIGSLALPDGSQLKIGPETKVFVPDGFPKKIRAIRLEGAAQFEVAPTSAIMPLPFRVVAKRIHVIATGTSFAVSAYPGDSTIFVTVKQGSVDIKTGKTDTEVHANQAAFADRGTVREATADERAAAFNWLDGRITIPNSTLRNVVGGLSRWFNMDVKVPDLPLLERPASLDVSLDSSGLALKQVEKSANVKFGYEGDTKVFRDATPAAKAAGSSAKGAAAKAPAKKSGAKKKK